MAPRTAPRPLPDDILSAALSHVAGECNEGLTLGCCSVCAFEHAEAALLDEPPREREHGVQVCGCPDAALAQLERLGLA